MDSGLDLIVPPDASNQDAASDIADTANLDIPAIPDGWARYPWLPPTCDVNHALNPGAAVPGFMWAPCTDGMAGCQQLLISWGSTGAGVESLSSVNAGWHDGSRGWLALQERLANGRGRIVVGSIDGTNVDALDYAWPDSSSPQRSCFFVRRAIGDGVFAVTLVAPSGSSFLWTLLRGSLGVPSNEQAGPFVTSADQSGAVAWPQYSFVSRSTWAADLEPVGWIARADSSLHVVARGNASNESVLAAGVAGADIFYVDYGTPAADGGVTSTLMVQTPTAAPITLVDGSNGDLIGAVSDGATLVWVTGVGRVAPFEYGEYLLWEAPYTHDSSALRSSARFVTLIDGGTSAAPGLFEYGFGRVATVHFVNNTGGSVLRIFNLADASYWDVHVRSGYYWGNILYVGPDEFAVELGSSGSPGGVAATIVRQRFDALGPPVANAGADF